MFSTGKMVLGLEIGRDISLESESIPVVQDETPVRQSRRIAQLKIKEQADRRRIEEESMRELEEKKESEKKKRKKQKVGIKRAEDLYLHCAYCTSNLSLFSSCFCAAGKRRRRSDNKGNRKREEI